MTSKIVARAFLNSGQVDLKHYLLINYIGNCKLHNYCLNIGTH